MKQAIQAVCNRDPDALDRAFSNLEEAMRFRNEVLPRLSPADARWFWQQTMTAGQLERLLDAVRDVCLAVAAEMELKPNVHYSLGSSEGLPTMVVPAEVATVFYARLPAARHSVLRFYLQVAV